MGCGCGLWGEACGVWLMGCGLWGVAYGVWLMGRALGAHYNVGG